MLQYFALPTRTDAAVCYDSHSLGYAVAYISCATPRQAQHEAARRKLDSAQRLVKLPQKDRIKFGRSPAGFFEREAA